VWFFFNLVEEEPFWLTVLFVIPNLVYTSFFLFLDRLPIEGAIIPDWVVSFVFIPKTVVMSLSLSYNG
jgi:uncharacterized protein (DUF983 family)